MVEVSVGGGAGSASDAGAGAGFRCWTWLWASCICGYDGNLSVDYLGCRWTKHDAGGKVGFTPTCAMKMLFLLRAKIC